MDVRHPSRSDSSNLDCTMPAVKKQENIKKIIYDFRFIERFASWGFVSLQVFPTSAQLLRLRLFRSCWHHSFCADKLVLSAPFTSFIEPRSIPHSLRNAVWAIPDCVLRCSARIFEREPRWARWPRVGVFLRPRRLSMSIIAQGLGFVKAEKCDFFRGRKPRNSRAQAGGLTSTREETARGNGCWEQLGQLFWLP